MNARKLALVLSVVLVSCGLLAAALVDAPDSKSPRTALQKMYNDGNYKDAYEGLRKLALDPNDDPRQVGSDLTLAVQCLQNLDRMAEVDAFREAVIKTHSANWRLLLAAAESYLNIEHHGYIVAGKFERGQKRGGGRIVNAADRDRVRALQLIVQALPLVAKEENHTEAADFYLAFSRILMSNRGYADAWRLQYLTDLAQLPDYNEGWYYGRQTTGAPVDADGNPIYYTTPKTYADAANDGQRWRWALAQAMEMSPERTNLVRWLLADFLNNQFGVQTLAEYGYWFARQTDDDTKKDESGTYALHTLGEDETIARLATGIKRFKLPDEFNYIKIYQQIAADPKAAVVNGTVAKTGYAAQSLDTLAQIFEDRRQYPRAAEYWRQAIKQFGPGDQRSREQRLTQIVNNWGRFEGTAMQPAGKGATVEFRFRNGKKVHFEAHSVNIDKLLTDVKAYLKSNPRQLDGNKINIGDIGHRLVEANEQQYVGAKVADWDLELAPRERHFDKRITVTTPLQKAGAYLVTAKMADGNTSRIILWLADTAIVKKPLSGKAYYYVGDAVTGAPVPKANVEFFGYRQKQEVQGKTRINRFRIETTNSAELTDADGQVTQTVGEPQDQYTWLITARTREGRLAYLGFTTVWHGNYYDQEYEATKVFAITDRPVYRPKQKVQFKFWVRHAKYDQEDNSEFAGKEFAVEIHNPKGDKVLEKKFKADDYGGIAGDYELPEDATLGMYQVLVVNQGGGTFRVEEYKKPEFEVTVDAPKEPVMLGEKVQASVTAKYYFGAPVTKAKVKYKVLRTSYSDTWYPIGIWDWFYGPGYWWFAYDYTWYPGWNNWGCRRPIPMWWPRAHQPPEVVAEAEVPIGPDGKLTFDIDTATAKEIHGDEDHQYSITAEVVDESRRTIVGTGNVLVARKPFKVFAWVDRGHYRVGDTINAGFSAHTLDRQPVQGKGKLELLKVTYNDKQQPVETPVRDWDLDTNAQGHAEQKIEATAAGQYRFSYKLTDAKGHTIEGGYVFTIVGEGFAGADFRYNNLELIPDQREYKPGDKIKLMINTDRVGSTVLLFLRPANGIYLPPKVIRMQGKSAIAEVEVAKKDMPNFFIEAVTISDSRLHNETKEIVVPPEKRVLNVAIEPSAKDYKPGQDAEVKVTLTDLAGKPFVGSTVMTIYDKAVEYISGGSNVPEIKAFFWKWRRNHYPQNETNLAMHFYNLVRSGQISMGDLGTFGGSVADEVDQLGVIPVQSRVGRFGGGGARFGAGGAMMKSAMADRAMPVAPMAAAPAAGAPASDALAVTPLSAAAAEEGAPPLVEATVRTQFADTALWAGSLVTDGDGTATVKLKMPENLTTWKIRCWGMGAGTKVGQADVDVITRKNLLVRMQAPRFFVEKDEVVLSANVHNYLPTKKSVQVALELDAPQNGGPTLKPMTELVRKIEIDAGGEQRVDWRVKVANEGEAVIRMKALTDEESDAVQMSFPAYVHGMLKMDSLAGAIRPDGNSGRFTIRIPHERRKGQSRLEVRYSPTLAGAMVDALPYMVEYPYGCTEQTLNRFLPTVVTQKILLDMKLDLKAIRDKRTNLNAQELGDAAKRAEGWKRYKRNPVFDQDEVRTMVKAGVQALADMQVSDGGWGWFSGFGEQSYPHTTATVVHGLQIAQANDVALLPQMLERGVAWLKNYQNEQVQLLQNAKAKKENTRWKDKADNTDALVYMVLVDAGDKNQAMLDFLYRDRTDLSVYAKALFGLALAKQDEGEKLAMIQRNIAQFLVQDDENQTAYLKLPEGNFWWHWYGSDIEAMAYYLKLLAKTDPKGETAPRLVKYLLNNRKHATYWNSTRDTALCIEAMADYLKASGENEPDMTVEVWMDGKKRKEVKITAADLFTFDNAFVLEGDAVEDGDHAFELKKQGRGPLYYNAYSTIFTLEDPIPRAGLEVKVNRKFYKLNKVDKTIKVAGSRGQAVDQKVEKYEREELVNLQTIKSGDLVEIELEIDSKNDYEYLLFEDMKAAGFEPVDVRSGYGGNDMGAYMELRDNRVAFFVRTLARGKHSVAYRIRAEIPGKFSALPARASAMYAPELKGNSDEMKIGVED